MQDSKKDPTAINIIVALRIAQRIKSTYIRYKSLQEYKNFIDRFEEYLKLKELDDLKISEFTKAHAIRYLDDVLLTRKVNAQTRNNYMRAMKALFYTLAERDYIEVNPFAAIKTLKETQKKRRTFTYSEKQTIIQYIKQDNKELLLAVCLCYYCAIRPAELRRLKVGNLDLKIGLIQMDGSQTKNKENATITIPKVLLPLLNSYHLNSYPKSWYLFGAGALKPAANPCGRDTISKKHKRVIKNLHLYGFLKDVEGKTFYSWKDTAARDLIEQGLNIMDLKQHFRHKELATTQRYLQAYGGVNDSIRDMENKIF
ncbi:tyrosine-type recombinase/integrase [Aureispira anguillae]|uniref:Tyrosine-type recombinase/integrase n=1 Tax=Aureispira anguillae TaxID=2864201 RepID=A0A915YBL8_9BACT|nr:site-specific integrase [Aureispira anguillae]BDS10088.1 tyrosine-type recombinase/integrase [Aureispira anguillae]